MFAKEKCTQAFTDKFSTLSLWINWGRNHNNTFSHLQLLQGFGRIDAQCVDSKFVKHFGWNLDSSNSDLEMSEANLKKCKGENFENFENSF